MSAGQTSISMVISNKTSCSWSRVSLAKSGHVSTAPRAGHGMTSHAESGLLVLTKCTRRQNRQVEHYIVIASRPFSGTPLMNVRGGARGKVRSRGAGPARHYVLVDVNFLVFPLLHSLPLAFTFDSVDNCEQWCLTEPLPPTALHPEVATSTLSKAVASFRKD